MAPIRLGLIGLTATPGAPLSTNSSVEAAAAAIKEHNLPADVKAYGSPHDIAADPDVEMVIVSVNVVKHYEAVKPALEAGKMAYVEWPLGNDTAEAEELTAIAKEKNLKTVVGLQGRQSNLTRTLKDIGGSGKLGRVLSTSVVAEAGGFDDEIAIKHKYITDSKVGGNMFTILYGHFFDSFSFIYVLGDFEQSQSILANQRPHVGILEDGKVVETIHKDTFDRVLLQGRLKSGAVASLAFRAGKPPGLTWKIVCESGEISVQAPGPMIQISYQNDTISIRTFENATGETKSVDIKDMEMEDMKTPARMIGRDYEAFASGGEYQTFEDTLA